MRRQGGYTMIEILIAIVLLSLAIIPVYNVFTQSRKAVFRSKVSYLAMHVARDLMTELRQLPFDRLEDVAADYASFRRLGDNLFTLTRRYRNSKAEAAGTLDRFTYPAGYRRIKVRMEIRPIGADTMARARLARLRLWVLWEETGEDREREDRQLRVERTRFETIIGRYGPGV